jgi:hypothetical protein
MAEENECRSRGELTYRFCWDELLTLLLPQCLSLRNRAPYFYEVGIKSNALLKSVNLSSFLLQSFRVRYMELISKGLNTMTGEEVLELCCKLSTEEQQLFDGGRQSILMTERWLTADYRDQQLKRKRLRT